VLGFLLERSAFAPAGSEHVTVLKRKLAKVLHHARWVSPVFHVLFMVSKEHEPYANDAASNARPRDDEEHH
jgi:hypothetical protein